MWKDWCVTECDLQWLLITPLPCQHKDQKQGTLRRRWHLYQWVILLFISIFFLWIINQPVLMAYFERGDGMAVCFSSSSLQVPSSGCVHFTFWTVKFSPLVGVHLRSADGKEMLKSFESESRGIGGWVCVWEREQVSLFVFMCVCPIFPPFTAYKGVFWI